VEVKVCDLRILDCNIETPLHIPIGLERCRIVEHIWDKLPGFPLTDKIPRQFVKRFPELVVNRYLSPLSVLSLIQKDRSMLQVHVIPFQLEYLPFPHSIMKGSNHNWL